MKVFLAVKDDNGIISMIDSRFARAKFFMIYDMEKEEILKIEDNKFVSQEHGVGIKIAGYAVEEGCKLAIGAKPGPKADEILKAGGIEFFFAENCTAGEAIENFKKSKES